MKWLVNNSEFVSNLEFEKNNMKTKSKKSKETTKNDSASNTREQSKQVSRLLERDLSTLHEKERAEVEEIIKLFKVKTCAQLFYKYVWFCMILRHLFDN